MALHTNDEYCQALEACTGMGNLSTEALPTLSTTTRADTIFVLQRGIELWQLNDIGDLQKLGSHLPATLHSGQSDLNDRINVLRFTQKPVGLEKLQHENVLFGKELEDALSKEPMPTEIIAEVRELRKRVEVLVWEASPLFVAQLVRDLRSME